MGRIVEVLYRKLPDIKVESCLPSYLYQNVIGLTDEYNQRFEEYELAQKETKDRVIANIKKEDYDPKIDTVIFGPSMRGDVIVMTELGERV